MLPSIIRNPVNKFFRKFWCYRSAQTHFWLWPPSENFRCDKFQNYRRNLVNSSFDRIFFTWKTLKRTYIDKTDIILTKYNVIFKYDVIKLHITSYFVRYHFYRYMSIFNVFQHKIFNRMSYKRDFYDNFGIFHNWNFQWASKIKSALAPIEKLKIFKKFFS